MKSGTTEHPKFRMLKARLRKPDYVIVGILESLWTVAAKWKDHGGIGQWSNIQIASAIDWDDDADDLISAMLETGWLDNHDEYRLMIHDWFDHCPEYVHDRQRKRFKRSKTDIRPNLSGNVRDIPRHSGTVVENRHQPNPTQPNPITPNPSDEGDAEPLPKAPVSFEAFWSEWPGHPRKAAKSQCMRKWERQGCDAIAEQVIDAVRRCKVSNDWTKNDGEFIPAPMTWLNQRRWEAAIVKPPPAVPKYTDADIHTPDELNAIFPEDSSCSVKPNYLSNAMK